MAASRPALSSSAGDDADANKDQNVGGLESTLYFYKLLKYRVSVRQDEQSQRWYQLHKQYLSKIKLFVLFVYIFVLPFLEAPNWCINKLKEAPGGIDRSQIALDCDSHGIPYSGNPTLSPILVACLEFCCLSFIVFFRWSKTKWGETDTEGRNYNLVFAIAFGVQFVDDIVAISLFRRPYLSNIMRPIVFGCFLHLVRVNARQFVHDLFDSLSMLILIFLFIGIYGIVGVYLFRYSFEGFQNFGTFDAACYNMIILMTTANFPDVMLPAYSTNYWYMIYFVSYLTIGLYFMMSFLLANVFNKFKERLEQQADRIRQDTERLLIKLFNRFDYQNKGYLSYDEAKEFFSNLLNLKLSKKKHYMALARLLDEMMIEDFDKFEQHQIVDFFIDYDGYGRFQVILEEENSNLLKNVVESQSRHTSVDVLLSKSTDNFL